MKRVSINILIFTVIVSCSIACKREISAAVPYESQTIITGSISNLSRPLTVTIQQTLPLEDASKFRAVEGASVSLYTRDAAGKKSLVTRDFTASQGNYTSSGPIAGKIGNRYWIAVQLKDGTQFKSREEILRPLVPIQSVIPKKDHFEVKFADPKEQSNFYRFVLEVDEKRSISLPPSSSSPSSSPSSFRDEPLQKEGKLYDDVVFNGNPAVAIQLPSTIPDRNSYTAKVTLENISSSTYQFWLNRKDNKDKTNAGDADGLSQLFNTPPAKLLGNIVNLKTKKRALGNFAVVASSVKEIEN